jgi:hypothetical protein
LVLVLGQKRKYENKPGEIFFKLQHVRLTQPRLQKINSSSTSAIYRELETNRGKFRPFLQRTPMSKSKIRNPVLLGKDIVEKREK